LRQKFSIKYLQNWIQHTFKRSCTRDARMVQLTKKPHDHLNRWGKSIWQNSTPLYDKISEETRNRRNITQHNKGYIW
jgi:hypothetical protein